MILVTALTYVERYFQRISTWNYNTSSKKIKSRWRFSCDFSRLIRLAGTHPVVHTCTHTDAGGGWPYSNGALFSTGENHSPLLRNCIVGNGGVICLPILAKPLSIAVLISHRGATSWSFSHKSTTIHNDACSAWCTETPVEEPFE